jgi:hypothetical protein
MKPMPGSQKASSSTSGRVDLQCGGRKITPSSYAQRFPKVIAKVLLALRSKRSAIRPLFFDWEGALAGGEENSDRGFLQGVARLARQKLRQIRALCGCIGNFAVSRATICV